MTRERETIIGAVWRAAMSDRISLSAAGCSFYALLALFPALSLLIAVYGLIFDPTTVEPQLDLLEQFLPEETHELIANRVHDLVLTERPTLEFQAWVSVAIAAWSSATGVRGLIGALNLASGRVETRGFLGYQATALAISFSAIVTAILVIATLVALPPALALFGVPEQRIVTLRSATIIPLLIVVGCGFAALYRFGPSGPRQRWSVVIPGALVATLLWAVASVLFSIYVSDWAPYDRTYGPLGTAVGLLMWFFVGIYALLLGAEVNAVLRRRAAAQERDTSVREAAAERRNALTGD